MPEEIAQDKVVSIMQGDRFCMVTSVGSHGRLHAHPMTPQEVTDDGDVWFFIDCTSEQAANIGAEKRVNLAFSDGSTWLSVAGHGRVLRDDAKIDELWNPMVEAWFPEGRDSPDLGLVYVESDSAEYWDTPGGRIASALAFVKTKVTGERPGGHSEAVNL
jgi:general stress protein 26